MMQKGLPHDHLSEAKASMMSPWMGDQNKNQKP